MSDRTTLENGLVIAIDPKTGKPAEGIQVSLDVPIETCRAILQGLILESKAAAFKITAIAKARVACGLTEQAEAQVKNLVSQNGMTEDLKKQLSELA